MTENRLNFTKRALTALPSPSPGKRAYYYDTKTRGLILAITPAGNKTFYLYRKIQGRPERVRIGPFPDMTVEKARGKASEMNAAIAHGKNPQDEQRAINAEMTLAALFDQYLDRHARIHKKSWKEDQTQFDRYLTRWKRRKLSNIRKQDIETLHAEINNNHGPYAANRLLALLSTLFNKARDWGWDRPNPAKGVKKFKEQARERFLEGDELPRFFEAVAAESNEAARDYILISLLTGARKSNVLAMRWQDVNLDRGTWRIPDTKSGEPHTIPLVDAAVAILKDRKNQRDQNRESSADASPWVFPSHGKRGYLVEPKKAWKRILDRAGIEDLRIHDLRRSLGSWQAATGANLSIIGKTLAHKSVNTTAIYARLNLDPVRESMNKATDAILQAAGRLPEAEVVKLKK